MKKLMIFILAFAPLVSSCKKDSGSYDHDQIREIAWNSISEQEKLTVIADWKQAPVEKTTYEGINVFSVRFNTTDDGLLGPITVYVDMTSKKVIGYATRM